MTSSRTLFQCLVGELSNEYPLSEAQALAYRLLYHELRLTRTDILLDKPLPVSQPDWTTFLNRLRAHEPLQYVLGETEFYGRPFQVTPDVLIPRPETEELMQRLLQDLSTTPIPGSTSLSILDVGTGSGCIAITLAGELPGARVEAWDISDATLAVARQNARRNGVSIDFVCQDVLSKSFSLPLASLSILVSNPPYVARSEAAHMHANVLEHEPHLALFVPDDDPLIFYEALAMLGAYALVSGGRAYLEINERFGTQTAAVFQKHGFTSAEVWTDLSGKDRFIRATR